LQHPIFIEKKLTKRKAENAFRELPRQGDMSPCYGTSMFPCLVDFCSNDYLGFAKETAIHLRQGDMSPCYGSGMSPCYGDSISPCYGATGSRLISGNHPFTEETERYLANFYCSEAALIFNAGYNANVGLFQCLPQRTDTVIYDEYIHASIRDGIKLSNAKNFAFEHNNLAALEQKLKQATGLIYVAVESIYSMDGDAAALKEISELCTKYNAVLIVDEAHAVGIFGNGRGLVVELGLENNVFARIVTFGKAFGGHGSAILGSNQLRDYLINFSRAFIYTTALPLSSIATIKNAHEFLLQNLSRINDLKEIIEYFIASTLNYKLSTLNSHSAIQCIIIKGNDEVKSIASKIQEEGFDVRPILSPTVPKGKERLRICLHSFNTKEQVDKLITHLNPPSREKMRTEVTLPLRACPDFSGGVGGVIINNPSTNEIFPLEEKPKRVIHNNFYNKNLKTFARENRKNMTKAEAKIWNELLRNKQCFGFKFLRQQPILNYIVDFMCPELKLIVEIDGYSHLFDEVYENDIIRQKKIEDLGYYFLRFTDDDVMKDFNNVIRTFEIYLETKKDKSPTLPSLKGGNHSEKNHKGNL